MGWSVSVDEGLADAVIASFTDSAERSAARLSAFKRKEWERAYPWLIASGMTLYFLDRIRTLGIEDSLPSATIAKFRQNLADNRRRNDSLMEEFIAINTAFVDAGIRYANVKGFTLSPGYCPDAALRNQFDFDFLVDEKDLEHCRNILTSAGYIQSVESASAWEFKAGTSKPVRTEDHYKPRSERRVELHFARAGSPRWTLCNEQLRRVGQRTWLGHSFPVPAPEDQFIAQALHILSHLRSPCTRLSWLLEYIRFVSSHEYNWTLWEDVRMCSHATRDASIAIGLATLLSRRFFGGRVPAQLNEWTLDRLPAGVRLWADNYGRNACLSKFPGTKLYLLLEGELVRGDVNWSVKRRRRLVPLRKVPQITRPEQNEGLLNRVRRALYQARFALFRLRFHLVEDLRYMVELPRWKRLLAAQHQYNTRSSPEERA